ncbi:hypothetical protein U9M48_026079 [Paspalum notatum var. saurae]|uniref:Uncharacterized protein n=1 Tax=Paspalum notatum var. saurae TaxID=547442 RepID=A0AAQ3TVC7_PASNO
MRHLPKPAPTRAATSRHRPPSPHWASAPCGRTRGCVIGAHRGPYTTSLPPAIKAPRARHSGHPGGGTTCATAPQPPINTLPFRTKHHHPPLHHHTPLYAGLRPPRRGTPARRLALAWPPTTIAELDSLFAYRLPSN